MNFAPAIKELLIRAHWGRVIHKFAAQPMKAFTEFTMQTLFIVSHNIKSTALEWAMGTEGGHDNMAARFDGSVNQVDICPPIIWLC